MRTAWELCHRFTEGSGEGRCARESGDGYAAVEVTAEGGLVDWDSAVGVCCRREGTQLREAALYMLVADELVACSCGRGLWFV